MLLFENVAKCTKCNNYVESSDIVNIDDTSDKYVCKYCEKQR